MSKAVIEATEEAVYNFLLMAEDVTKLDPVTRQWRTIEALPIDNVKALLKSPLRDTKVAK